MVSCQHELRISAAGCAESDKTSSMSMPGGCKATGSASSEKYEASGNELTHTTYSSNDCTGTAVTTTATPCGGGTCTADGSVWMKIVLDCPTTMTTTATATATATATTTATATAMATSTATAMATATATTTGGATATTAAASVDSGSSLLRMELPLLLFLIRLLI